MPRLVVMIATLGVLLLASYAADAQDHFAMDETWSWASITGDNQLMFADQQSQTEVTALFAGALPTLTNP